MLSKLLKQYNNKIAKHADVSSGNKKHSLKTVYNRIKISGKAKLRVEVFVRVSENKNIFAEGYAPNWSTEPALLE